MTKIKFNKKTLTVIHCIYWVSFTVALLAFFEQCLNNGAPLFSSVLGSPFLHHGYYGFIFMAVAYSVVMLITIFKKETKND